MLKIIKFENFYSSTERNVQRGNYGVAGRGYIVHQLHSAGHNQESSRPILSEVPESSQLVVSLLEQKNSNFVAYIAVKCLLCTVQ